MISPTHQPVEFQCSFPGSEFPILLPIIDSLPPSGGGQPHYRAQHSGCYGYRCNAVTKGTKAEASGGSGSSCCNKGRRWVEGFRRDTASEGFWRWEPGDKLHLGGTDRAAERGWEKGISHSRRYLLDPCHSRLLSFQTYTALAQELHVSN